MKGRRKADELRLGEVWALSGVEDEAWERRGRFEMVVGGSLAEAVLMDWK